MANFKTLRILCNSNQIIGFGHFYRCLIIARRARLKSINVEWFGNLEHGHYLELRSLGIQVMDLEYLIRTSDDLHSVHVIDVNVDKDVSVVIFLRSTSKTRKILRDSFYFMNHPEDFQDSRFLIWPYFNPINNPKKSSVVLKGFDYFIFSEKIDFTRNKPHDFSYDLALVMGATDPRCMANQILDNIDLDCIKTVVITKSELVASQMSLRENVHVRLNGRDLITNTIDVRYVLCNDGLSKYEMYKYLQTPFGLVSDATENDEMQRTFAHFTGVKYFGDCQSIFGMAINEEVDYYNSNIKVFDRTENDLLLTKIIEECRL